MIFLRVSEVTALHARLVARFGGAPGLRDEGALASALAAAENRHHYEGADLTACAATYAYHLVGAHAFVDGNKRVGAAVMEVFLVANGASLDADDDALYDWVMGLARGALSRDAAEAWLRAGRVSA